MADIFDEISEDLRAERAQQLLKRYGFLLVIAAVLVVVAAGGWQAWRWQQTKQSNAVAAQFLAAMQKAAGPPAATGGTPSQEQASVEFGDIAKTAPEGYATLARLRAAGLRASGGDLPGAMQMWDQVAADGKADPLLRGLANLMWVQHQVDKGEPSAVEERLGPLLAVGNPWRALALEEQALLNIRTGQDAKAREILKGLQADATAPDGVRGRAGGLLSRLGDGPADAAPAKQGAGG